MEGEQVNIWKKIAVVCWKPMLKILIIEYVLPSFVNNNYYHISEAKKYLATNSITQTNN
jgi:hypothetical protein